MTITGNVGRVVRLPGDFGEANINQHIARIRVTSPRSLPEFVFHFLSQTSVRKHYELITTGQAYPQISLKQVRETVIPLPRIEEQQPIAEALSETDASLDALAHLIAKKRAMKLGAMSQLLTGRTRLTGFHSEWTEKRLGDVAAIKTGSKNNQDKVADGTYPFFVRSAIIERINTYSYDGEAILVPGEGGIGSIFHYINAKFDVHQRVYKISDFSSAVNGRFIYYAMSHSFGRHAMRNTVKATVDSLRLPTFKNFAFPAPADVGEQVAIADALADMDFDIEALTLRLEKMEDIKRGIMQALLTGRVRLTEEKVGA